MLNTYAEAIKKLNDLQLSSEAAQKLRSSADFNEQKVRQTEKILNSVGIEIEHLKSLNAIHIAGTKGKGSTAALCESIFRSCGLKTGLYTSPHLICVRERIQINGVPLSEEQFVTHFSRIYSRLRTDVNEECPRYFTFLTCLAFQVFLSEKVDVAIIEVGVGGEYDATNVLKEPIAVGITSLGYDHLSTLRDSIESIAWHKSGIFKKSVPAFTVPQTFAAAMAVLRKRADEKQCPLYVCPALESYTAENDNTITVGIEGEIQRLNASLALQLHNAYRNAKCNANCGSHCSHSANAAAAFRLNRQQLNGLRYCKWPGRCQLLQQGRIEYFLDGAHTDDSVKHCVRWFTLESRKLSEGKTALKLLLFNCTGQRNVNTLLQPLSTVHFDVALFTTNNRDANESKSDDNMSLTISSEMELALVANNCRVWKDVIANRDGCDREPDTRQFACISQALEWIRDPRNQLLSSADSIQLLVTGSIHLVGGVLSIIDPKLTASTAHK